jgi:hypothetical protein
MIRTEDEGRAHAKENHGRQAPPGKSHFRDEEKMDELIDQTKQTYGHPERCSSSRSAEKIQEIPARWN